ETEETGLYYNRFRYYMPEEGIYTQRDPIGLAGGNPTVYGYVYDTNSQIDPWGLRCTGGNPKSQNNNSNSDLSRRGYVPKPGERTFDGFVKNNVSPNKEVTLNTNSAGFNNNNGNIGGQFKRIGADTHAGLKPHVHQPIRNVAPNGNIHGQVGSKTSNGGVTSPGPRDIRHLYDFLFNGKYR
ncbi:MAG: hypothetical protein FWF50_01260, partial [Defluviitaleaceae bacterium]|nr:hypothetical protein [Defluviitaleaceae bacterium]